MKVQRRWRGAMTRQKLLNMLDLYKFRRKQIHNYFLPKSRIERQQAKRKFQVAVAQKDVSAKATKSKLAQLKDTILETAGADPLEDPTRTAQEMNKTMKAAFEERKSMVKKEKPPINLPVLAPYDSSRFGQTQQTDEGEKKVQTGDDFSSRIAQEKTLREEELTNKDIRNARDLQLRQILRIDNRPSGDPMEKYKPDKEGGGELELFEGTKTQGQTNGKPYG